MEPFDDKRTGDGAVTNWLGPMVQTFARGGYTASVGVQALACVGVGSRFLSRVGLNRRSLKAELQQSSA